MSLIMARLTVLTCLLVIMFTNCCNTNAAADNDLKVELISGVDFQQHPQALQLEKRELQYTKERAIGNATVHYVLGERIPNDARVVYKQHSYIFASAQAVSIKAQYPSANSTEPAATVSMVDIIVHQSNEQGRAYVIDGGIGQKNITFVIEADNTLFISYNISIYGYF